jgi:hypothetical protein
MTHDFNLTDLEQSKVEDVISSLREMIIEEQDSFYCLLTGILELIYGVKKAEKIQKFLDSQLDPDSDDYDPIIEEFDDCEFFKENGHLKKVQALFTKKRH